MRRRYKALLAIAVPTAVVYTLKYTHQASYQWLMGYMFAIALIFKSSLLSLWFASKLKVIAFLKSLTLFQGLLLLIKRWFLDNIVTQWIKTNIIEHLLEGFKEVKEYYARLNLKAKLKNLFTVFLVTFFLGLLVYWLGYLDKLLFFAHIKTIASALFQGILTYVTKLTSSILSWFATSWLAPVFEVFALSYLLTLFEKWFGADNPISRLFNFIGDKLNMLLYYLGLIKQKHIDPMVECKVISNSKKVNDTLTAMIKNKKIREEYRYFDKFENIIMKGHIDAYHSFKGMQKIRDKKELYKLINKKTNDNIDIVAYVSRNHLGILLDEQVQDTFYHDIFLLESFASHQEYGVKVYDENPEHIDHTDFWVLNTSKFPVIIGSKSNNFEEECVFPHGLRLIKTEKPFSYASGDVYCEYGGVQVAVTAIERV
ncbi:hypothetical protein MNB_SV-3-286 [hydrothermal vent metagenome]|uniref:Uncharacterized protein n=1 Tax=hydrothermal vent metagenome TaxID=652676 RepID=A0A1W1CT36_9ZZZZ